MTCCKEMEDILSDMFNSIREHDGKIFLDNPDNFSKTNDINFCPFCGAKIN